MQHIIIDSPGITISYDYHNKWLYVNWWGEHNQESGRAGCDLILTVLSEWPAAKILNDNSNVTRAALQLTTWGISWLRDMYAAGLRYLAWVYAPDFQGRAAADKMMRYLEKPLVATFDDVASAYTWLRQQK
ncbi:hypothetical protein MUN84_04360 [Hymenobacter sp. 5516J-16]|uniref:STAS/SEC14 domain-containing protein n=1 Tax=Hymenobacter sublimis TaxID=2933777 RepID=A0ABY4J7X1_9BACT|nr:MULTISPECIES: hypothetical protein [Hymenobacter]UOQ77885.1 hypothetical protein MUN84_04360 [Hymenobacter sp. 5516J-16]UPL47869.1 hypothetical protein MWH26_11750 [Hymenobacter sublimis]